jgi:hypothetical protein
MSTYSCLLIVGTNCTHRLHTQMHADPMRVLLAFVAAVCCCIIHQPPASLRPRAAAAAVRHGRRRMHQLTHIVAKEILPYLPYYLL